MGKKVLIAMAVLFCISSAGLGYAGYQAASRMEAEASAWERFDWVIPLTEEYWRIYDSGMDNGCFTALKEQGGADLLDRSGTVIDQQDCNIYGKEDFYTYSKKGKMGCKKIDGSIMIPAVFDYIEEFDDQYALANSDGCSVAIDRKGTVFYRFSDDEDSDAYQIKGRYFMEQQGDRYRIIDVVKGKIVKEVETPNGCYIQPWGESGYVADAITGSCFLDGDFSVTCDGKLFESGSIGACSDGLTYGAWIVDGNWENGPSSDRTDVRKGYFDREGNMAIDTPDSISGGKFSEGKALVYEAKRVYCIDKKGRQLFQLSAKKEMEKDEIAFRGLGESCFIQGTAPVYDGENWGLVDEEGNWLIVPIFDDMNLLDSGFIAVEYRGKWGLIDGKNLLAEAAEKGEL